MGDTVFDSDSDEEFIPTVEESVGKFYNSPSFK